jgi:FkbM family methyltransferase
MTADAVRRLSAHSAVLPLTARVLCARIVREAPVFFWREIVRPSGVKLYTLRETGIQVALRHSARDSATLAEVFHQHDYLPDQHVAAAIGTPKTILDLGANIGLFGAYAAVRWPDAEIVAYEADPDNAAVHEHTIEANGLSERWRLVPAAAGVREGSVRLAAGRAMGSFVVAEGEDPGVPMIDVPIRDVMAEVCSADLVKIDIEGSEWAILLDSRFTSSPPRALVLEYHPHLCPTSDPRSTAEGALAQAGMEFATIWHRDDGYGMMWAWRA